jgi:hypothetical protein
MPVEQIILPSTFLIFERSLSLPNEGAIADWEIQPLRIVKEGSELF